MKKMLEEVIQEASATWCEKNSGGAIFAAKPDEAAAIAAAVRKWMDGDLVTFASVRARDRAARIKELEAEVERLTEKQELWNASEANHVALRDKAAKYDELRARFPYLPGETFYVLRKGIICERRAGIVAHDCVRDAANDPWNWDECHPTVEACRAAIPVEGETAPAPPQPLSTCI